MKAAGISLKVSGEGDRAAAQAALWKAVRDFIGVYIGGSSAYAPVREYVWEVVSHDHEIDRLNWSFDDLSGCCSRSAWAWHHWFRLALAADWNRLRRVAGDHGLTLEGEPPSLAELLAGDDHYVVLRGDLWSVGETGLHGDDQYIDVAELTTEERARHTEARERCMCLPCAMLRPEPAFRTAMLNALNDSSMTSAAWYLARTHETSPEVLTALVRAGDGAMRALLPAVERYAPRVTNAWPTLQDLLPDLRGGARGLALYALAAISGDAAHPMLIHELSAALDGSDEAAEAAAELAGRVGHDIPGLADRLAAILNREASDELRHNAVLGLLNLHAPPRPAPSDEIRVLLRREALRDTEAGRLAKWALTLNAK
ncbi:hypothetical protein ABZ897_61420 [Nonomuraea sp. NPDC046802]|uniref:hypothetical protein n=1 Tax=Nonomuraea sp. NPDC046802 TaxID=3154919 RepID=UPI0034090C14